MNLSPLKLLNSISLILLTVFQIHAQEHDPKLLDSYKKKYPNSNVIITERTATVKIEMVKNVPVVSTTYYDEFLILNQTGAASLTNDEISFSSFEHVEEIDAHALVPNGSKFKKIKAENFLTKDAENDGSIFHDDNKITTFMFPGLTEGSYRIVKYTEVSTENRFPFGFTFSSVYPLEKAHFTIECDSNIHIKSEIFNETADKLNFSDNIVRGKRVLSWQIQNPKISKREENAPPARYYSLHVLAQISHYNTKTGRVNVLETPDDLHSWYKQHIQNVLNEKPSLEMKNLTDSLTKNITNEIDKVKAIFYWVQNNIKYIAFEEGINGFVPRQPNSVLFKRYGDCKDMASLLYSMMRYAHINAFLTWIGTRDLPYKYSEFPSSVCDNHMITTFFSNKKPYFLDATCSFLPFGYPSHGILGKEAFLHISDSEFKIVSVPTMSDTESSFKDVTTISIDNRKLIGKSSASLSGFYNIFINEAYKNLTQEKQNDLVQSYHQKGNNTFKVTSSTTKNVGERDSNLVVNYDFEVNNYVTSFENEIFVNLVLDKDVAIPEMEKDRAAPFWNEFLGTENYTVNLSIPAGYSLKTLPKNNSLTSDFLDFSVEYKVLKNNTIQLNLKKSTKFLLLEPENFTKWNEFVKIIKSTLNESVVLQKSK